jgi:hypothetical protein
VTLRISPPRTARHRATVRSRRAPRAAAAPHAAARARWPLSCVAASVCDPSQMTRKNPPISCAAEFHGV